VVDRLQIFEADEHTVGRLARWLRIDLLAKDERARIGTNTVSGDNYVAGERLAIGGGDDTCSGILSEVSRYVRYLMRISVPDC
jgi:hypothetical protein